MKNFHRNDMTKFIKNAVPTAAWLIIHASRMKSSRILRDLIDEIRRICKNYNVSKTTTKLF